MATDLNYLINSNVETRIGSTGSIPNFPSTVNLPKIKPPCDTDRIFIPGLHYVTDSFQEHYDYVEMAVNIARTKVRPTTCNTAITMLYGELFNSMVIRDKTETLNTYVLGRGAILNADMKVIFITGLEFNRVRKTNSMVVFIERNILMTANPLEKFILTKLFPLYLQNTNIDRVEFKDLSTWTEMPVSEEENQEILSPEEITIRIRENNRQDPPPESTDEGSSI